MARWDIERRAVQSPWLVAVVGCVCAACGQAPSQLGVTVDRVGVTRSAVGPTPADLPASVVDETWERREADLQGDGTIETIVRLPDGRGVGVRDESGRSVAEIVTPHYLTWFGTVRSSSGTTLLVLYTYPNERKGGTFSVLDANRTEVARWDEFPAPGRFTPARWRGEEALFYLQGDALIVRSPSGQRLGRLAAPQGGSFRGLLIGEAGHGRTVVVASGSGYTPFHMVSIYDEEGELVFNEVNREHAFALETAPSEAIVSARSTRWKYTIR